MASGSGDEVSSDCAEFRELWRSGGGDVEMRPHLDVEVGVSRARG